MYNDKADWHWDSTEKLYKENYNIEGDLSRDQVEEVWLLASNHIGLFLRWIIENNLEGEEANEEICQKVRNGDITGAEYLMKELDGKFLEEDVKEEVLPFVKEYYDKKYYKDYGDICIARKQEKVYCYGFISGDDDYKNLKNKIDIEYKKFFR